MYKITLNILKQYNNYECKTLSCIFFWVRIIAEIRVLIVKSMKHEQTTIK